MIVEVTSGHIVHGADKYFPGERFSVSEKQAMSFVALNVAKIVQQEEQEDQPVVCTPEVAETTEQSAGPVIHVEPTPFETPLPEKKKRGRRKKIKG